MDGDDDTGVDATDGFAIIDESDVIPTAEAVSAGNPGDPLEVLYKFHPETILDYVEKISPFIAIQQVPPSEKSKDTFHKTQPFLSVYEYTRILGFRANQLAQGAPPYIVRPEHITSVFEISKMELDQRRLPYIIKRPIPDGTFEYWRLADLMIL